MNSYADKPWLAAYAPGVPHEIAEPTETLVDMIEASVTRYGRGTALEFFGATTSYRQLGEQIDRAAEGLRRLGVDHGDRVALVLPNCPQHVVAFYAILRLGAVVIEHNPLYTPRELRHQFEDHGATVVIVLDKIYDTVADFPSDLGVKHIISVDLTQALPLGKRLLLRMPIEKARTARAAMTTRPTARGVLGWEKVADAPRIPSSVRRPTLDDIAVLQYTSGTTGAPKGAILTHRNLRANAMQGRAWVVGLREGKENFYGVLPLFHAYGLTLCLTFAMSIGARLVLFPRYDLKMVLDAVRKTPPTFLPAVPPIYDQLAKAAAAGLTDLGSVRFAISGAMSLPVATVELWEKVTGGLLVEGYGLTECSPVAVGNPIGPSRRPGTIGVPFPSTEIRVVDPDDPTVDRPFGEAGELLIRGPQVFQGYWNRPDDTAATLLPDGWLRSGDIVTVSADGFVTVIDRIKELIITGGFNVSPTEVEETLVSHADIDGAAVVGIRRASGNEDVSAAVVMRPGATLDEKALRDYCRTRLAAYKVPRTIVEIDELPRSLIGKVERRRVKEMLVELDAKKKK